MGKTSLFFSERQSSSCSRSSASILPTVPVMTVLLSRSDLARVRAAQEVLLAPCSGASSGDWIANAAAAVTRLLDATHVSVLASGPRILYTTLPERAKQEFIEYYAARDEATPKALASGLFTAHIYDVLPREKYLASELHHDFAVPNRLFDAMLLRARTAPARSVWMAIQHGRELCEQEIEQRRALLEIILPSFSAGITAYELSTNANGDLVSRIDSLPAALILVDAAGQLLHVNRALSLLLANDAGASRLIAEMREMGHALLHSLQGDRAEPVTDEMVRIARTPSARYRLSAALAGDLRRRAAAVHAAPLSPLPADATWLRARFGLTARELQVAQLLGERLTNREIATVLRISEHTAERHTERVLQKLSLHSRSDVREIILDGDVPG
jgi:DNA-binding CsgD family transcriptional regulator